MSLATITDAHTRINLSAHESWAGILVHDGKEEKNVTVYLRGEGAEAKMYAVFFGKNHDVCDMNLTIVHEAPHTTSHIVAVGALTGEAHGNITGAIRIQKNAKQSNGREEIHTLLLSKDAKIGTLPELNIENDEVQCSHAVTTTHIDDIKQFYLESRGMNEHDATQAIVHGHIAPVLDAVSGEAKQLLEKKLEEFLATL